MTLFRQYFRLIAISSSVILLAIDLCHLQGIVLSHLANSVLIAALCLQPFVGYSTRTDHRQCSYLLLIRLVLKISIISSSASAYFRVLVFCLYHKRYFLFISLSSADASFIFPFHSISDSILCPTSCYFRFISLFHLCIKSLFSYCASFWITFFTDSFPLPSSQSVLPVFLFLFSSSVFVVLCLSVTPSVHTALVLSCLFALSFSLYN